MLNQLYKIVKNNKALYFLYSISIKKLIIANSKRQIRKRKMDIKNNGLSIISEIDQYVNNSGIDCFVDSGTLLGTVRGGKLLSWDYDIDFGIFITEEYDWNYFEECMNKIGYKKVRQFKYKDTITEQTYKRGDTYIDFFNHFSDEHNSYYQAYIRKPGFVYGDLKYMHPLKYKTVKISGLRMAKLESISVHVPNEAEEYLSALYGDDWRIPNPNWVEDGNLPSCEFLEGFGVCEKF